VNGAPVKGATFSRGGGGGGSPGGASAAIVAKIAVSTGNYTVEIWASSPGGPTTINALSQLEEQHATLLVEEVKVSA
jgi:hypothetical protein